MLLRDKKYLDGAFDNEHRLQCEDGWRLQELQTSAGWPTG